MDKKLKFKHLLNGQQWLIHFLLIGFFSLYLVKVISYQFELRFDSWLMGEWLINYQGGFTRRGLLGEAFLLLSPYFSIHITSMVIAVKSVIYTFILIFIMFIPKFTRRRFGWLEMIALFSPWALMFEVIDPRASGRKEILLIAAFLIFMTLIPQPGVYKKSVAARVEFWYLLLTLPLLVLIHEGFIFFFVFFGFVIISNNQYSSSDKFWMLIIPISISLIIFGYFFIAGPIDASKSATICRSVTDMKIESDICVGAIDSLKYNLPEIQLIKYISYYWPEFILISGYLFIYAVVTNEEGWKNTLFIILGSFVFITPLFYASFDWGRWLHIYGMMLFILLLYKPNRTEPFLQGNRAIYIFLLILIAGAYIFLWRLRPFIGENSDLNRILFDPVRWFVSLTKFN